MFKTSLWKFASEAISSLVENENSNSSFIQKGLVVGGGNIIARALGFLFPVILAWILDQNGYGFVRYVIATATLLGQILISGYPTVLARYVGKHLGNPDRQITYFSNICFANMLFMLIVTVVGCLLCFLNKFDWEVLLVLVGLVVDYTFFAVLQGLLQAKWLSIYAVSSKALQIFLIMAIYLISGRITPQLALIVYGFANLPSLLLIAISAPLGIKFKPKAISSSIIWETTRFAVPLLVNAVAYGVLMGFDSWLIRNQQGLEAVAIYNAAKTLTVVFSFAPFAVNTILMPTMAKLGSWKAGKKYYHLSFLLCTVVSLVLVGVFVFLSNPITAVVFPASYSMVSQIVIRLAIGSALFYLYSVLSQTWTGLGKPYVPASFLSLAAVVNVVLNILLLSKGLLGATTAFTVSCFLALLGLGLVTKLSENGTQ